MAVEKLEVRPTGEGFQHVSNIGPLWLVGKGTFTDEAGAHLFAAADGLIAALEPFAKFACSPPGECHCNNCEARAALAASRVPEKNTKEKSND